MASTSIYGTFAAALLALCVTMEGGWHCRRSFIMMIRAVPDGDEHDKDIANAIRYAVNNGAQIISMSFWQRLFTTKTMGG